jgi:hypothetical protein
MPRLTNPQYLKIHHALAWYWQNSPRIYSTLAPNEQWDIHAYFVPYKFLPDQELLQHRNTITKERPSLPQKAGRAFNHLDRNIEQIRERQAKEDEAAKQAPPQAQPSSKQSRYRTSPRPHTPEPIKVQALVRPEINVEMLARACIALARLQLAEQKAQEEKKTKGKGKKPKAS